MELPFIITGIIIAGLAITIYILKKARFQKMLLALQTQNFDDFFELTNKTSSKYLFPRFNLEYLKLNAYILKGDSKKIAESFDFIFTMRMSQKQKDDVYMKAFNYYVSLEDKKKTKELIEIIETFKNEALKREARTIYDIFILKKANYVEAMENDLPNMDNAQKGITEYLLSVQYTNINNKKKAEEYLELSKKHLSEDNEKR